MIVQNVVYILSLGLLFGIALQVLYTRLDLQGGMIDMVLVELAIENQKAFEQVATVISQKVAITNQMIRTDNHTTDLLATEIANIDYDIFIPENDVQDLSIDFKPFYLISYEYPDSWVVIRKIPKTIERISPHSMGKLT